MCSAAHGDSFCLCRRKLLASLEKKQGMASDKPFKMSSPMKHSSGLGDMYGTLQGKLEYIAVRACPACALISLMHAHARSRNTRPYQLRVLLRHCSCLRNTRLHGLSTVRAAKLCSGRLQR